MNKKLIERIDKLEKKCLDYEKRIIILENNRKLSIDNNYTSIIIKFIKDFKEPEEFYFTTYNEEEIRKKFSAQYIYKFFTKGNKYLYGGYYQCGINGTVNIVLSDTEEQLQKDIINLGMDE